MKINNCSNPIFGLIWFLNAKIDLHLIIRILFTSLLLIVKIITKRNNHTHNRCTSDLGEDLKINAFLISLTSRLLCDVSKIDLFSLVHATRYNTMDVKLATEFTSKVHLL